MHTSWQTPMIVLVALLLAACTPAATPPDETRAAADQQPRAPKRVVAGIMGDPPSLSNTISRAGAGGTPGVDALEQLVSAGLVVESDRGQLQPQLAEMVPTIENGRWRLLPDGRMETTWTIKPGVEWHDGTPFSVADLAFTVQVGQDREIPALSSPALALIEAVEEVDPRTVLVRWRQPFIQADELFTYAIAVPIPRHLLERAYQEDKANFVQAPYWMEEFVGLGPFRVRSLARGSHISLVAYERYVPGRPKLDEVEVRFIPDPGTLIANVLAGEVELTMGRGLSLEQALQVRDQWREGGIQVVLTSWVAAYPQMLNPNPPSVADARFRRALLHAVDRQAIVDTIQAGQSYVGHSYLPPTDPNYRAIEPSIVRYEHDPRRAAELIEGLGYRRAADGFYQDAAGQRLVLETRTTGGDDMQEKTLLSVADNWNRAGLFTEPVIVPRQRASDREYRANFPAFEQVRQPNDLSPGALLRYHGSEAALPENNYRGNNRMRYRSPELDALIDRFYVTIPPAARDQLLAQIIGHMTENVIPLGLFYNTQPSLVANRLQHVSSGTGGVTAAWNAHEWDVR